MPAIYPRRGDEFEGISPLDYGARFDGRRMTITSATGTSLVGGSWRVGADIGKIIYIEGAGASRTLTCTTFDPAATPPKALHVATAETMTSADVGSVIQIPGAKPGGGTHVTFIRAVITPNLISIRDTPSTTPVVAVTGSAQRYHRSQVTSVSDTTHATIADAIITSPATVQGGPGVFLATDDQAAFQAMNADIATLADATLVNVPVRETAHRLHRIVILPEGVTYLSAGSLFPAPGQTTNGFTYQGAGGGATEIVYGPTSTGQYLFTDPNPARWNRIRLKHFEVSAIGHNQPGFWRSQSAGAQQGHYFEDVWWTGDAWADVFNTDGTDTNDKWLFNECVLFAAHFDNFIRIPATGSQQQLHYTGIGGQWEWVTGNLFNVDVGGNINWLTYGVMSGAGTYFKLGSGSQDKTTKTLYIAGSRFERRLPTCLLMECGWSNGTIVMSGVADAIPVQQAGGTARIDVSVRFTPKDAATPGYPSFKADRCQFKGRHEYQYYGQTGEAYRRKNALVYEGCNFTDWTYPEDAFVFTQLDAGTAVSGGIPVVSLDRNCRGDTLAGAGMAQASWEADLNGHLSSDAKTRLKVVRIANARGKITNSSSVSNDVFLPKNHLVRRVWAYLEAGATAHTTAGLSWLVRAFGTKDAVISNGGSDLSLIGTITIPVVSMPAGTPASGNLSILNKTFDRYLLTYTGVSGNTFTGVTGGGGSAVDGGIVEVFNPVTLATITPTGDNPSLGIDVESSTRLRMTTAAARHLQLVSVGTTPLAEYAADVFVEYL